MYKLKAEQQAQMAQQQSLVDQAGQLASAPMMDPSKNPELMNGGDTQTPVPTEANLRLSLPADLRNN